MIVGNGLIANAVQWIDRDDVTLFCSGVSNSAETAPEVFQREINLILEQDQSKLFIYFSTISVFNDNYKGKKYREHKLNCEKLIANNFTNYIIIRLPNVVSLNGNRNNLFPFFYHSILNAQHITIYKNATRYLVAAEDIAPIVSQLFKANFTGTLNACFNNPPLVLDLYLYMCEKLEKPTNYSFGESEDHPIIDNKKFIELMSNSDYNFKTDWKPMIDSYLLFETEQQS